MMTQRIRPVGASMGSWSVACTAASTALAVIVFPVMGPVGGIIASLTATLTGHDNYSGAAMFGGMFGLPALTGAAAVGLSLAAVKVGLVRVPTR